MSASGKSSMTMFTRLVRDCMDGVVASAGPQTPCGEIVRMMREGRGSCVVITSPEDHPVGIFTERDIVQRIAFLASRTLPAEKLMTTPLRTVREDDYLFHAIALMHRNDIRHLPVTKESGEIAGVLDLHKALAEANPRTKDLIERLTHEESVKGLRQVKRAQVELAGTLLEDHLPAIEVQSLLTDINRDIYRRVLALLLRGLLDEGWGDPPVPFDVIAMGSCGRGESFLFPDQDFGFILADYPAQHCRVVDTYFTELAERVSRILGEVGFPLCRGQVMAQNSLWRKTLPQWILQVSGWIERADLETLRLTDIFFDFQHVSGTRALAVSLRKHVTQVARNNHVFLKAMQQVQQDHGVALGLMGKLDTERVAPRGEALNLKYHGLLPLVEAVRLLALREGVVGTSTKGRIAALYDSGILGHNDQDALVVALEHLTHLLLRQQIADFSSGLEVGPLVRVELFSTREKSTLVESLRAVNGLRERVRSEFTANVFG